ncbi:UNKNOWN [Stylonychia lemnae]|uniref:GT44 domain-containing protein n=1 Tax=Stylonychia lemnae TaxID=5949 RepID=A0A077ZS82_STYLE|nr:UNKNOWN [Stylonychia lemnae]|eukprot:CDW72737.1 UNKNOWN [Stylonychia lemnae]
MIKKHNLHIFILLVAIAFNSSLLSANCFIFKSSYEVMPTLTFAEKFTLTTLNILDICTFPKTIYYGNEHLVQREITKQIIQESLNAQNSSLEDIDFIDYFKNIQQLEQPQYFESEKIVYHKSDQMKIPLVTHRIWLTDLNYPKEITDVVPSYAVEQLGTSYKVFNQSAQYQGYKWSHYLWVQDKQKVPETIKLFKNFGVITKELKELDGFHDGRVQNQYQYYMKDLRAVAAASDLIRVLIVYEQGGLYFDNDYTFWHWDYNINFYFDFMGVGLQVTQNTYGLNNAFFASKSGHLLLEKYLHYVIKQFRKHDDDLDDRPFYQNTCSYMTAASTLYGTGPAVLTAIALNYLNKDGNQDIVISDRNKPQHKSNINIIDLNGIKGQLMIDLVCMDYQTNLWRNDFKDARVFGFPQYSKF